MTTLNSLMAAAVEAFEQWRGTRANPTERTPEPLQRQAVALLEYYSANQITATLAISGANLKSWAETIRQQDVVDFVPLSLAGQTNATDLNIELSFHNGCRMSLQGNVSAGLLVTLAQGLANQAHGYPEVC